MANFEQAFSRVIMIEGGYVNDPTDRGGETNYGISKRAFPNVDIKNLTLEQAKDIYRKHYWDKMLADSFPQAIAEELFDTAVNMGVGAASKMLQRGLNLLNRNGRNFPDLVVDGIIGKKTINAFLAVDNDILLKVLNGLQFMRYVEITERDPSQEKFFNGWMRRV